MGVIRSGVRVGRMHRLSPAAGLLLALLLPGLPAPAAAQGPAAIPPQAAILSTLQTGHPRLLTPPGGFAAVKAGLAGNADLSSWAEYVEDAARGLLAKAPSKYEIPDGLRLLATSRQVKERVYLLGMAYHLTGDSAFAGRAWRELAAAAAFPDWNPRHFLDVGEMTHAFAIGYDWLHAYLTPQQRTVIRAAIIEKGLKPADSAYQSKAWWVSSPFNWNQVCNGGVALGALAIAGEEKGYAAALLHRALTSLVASGSMEGFAPDGGWAEGPAYWNYTIEYVTLLLAGLESALGTTFGIAGIPGLSQAGYFPLYTTGPTGRSFNYADAHRESPAQDAGQYWLARAYGQPVFAWARRRLTTGFGPKDILWHTAEGRGPKAAGLPLDRHFRHLDLVAFRSAWEDTNALFAGFKAGSNAVNHSHLDLGTFLIDALGVRWAGELGSDDYNLPGYFTTAGPRWNYYRLRAEGQNTLVLNPGMGPDQEPKAAAAVTRFSAFPDEASAIADLTPAYAGKAGRVQRGFALTDNRTRFLVQDEIQADTAVEVWWFMHTRTQVKVAPDGRSAALSEGGKRLFARLLSPAEAKFTVMAAGPLSTSPDAPGQNRNSGWRKLAVRLTGKGTLRLAVQFVPLRPGASEPTDRPALRPLGPDWPTGKTAGLIPRRSREAGHIDPSGRAGEAGAGNRARAAYPFHGGLFYGLDGRLLPATRSAFPR